MLSHYHYVDTTQYQVQVLYDQLREGHRVTPSGPRDSRERPPGFGREIPGVPTSSISQQGPPTRTVCQVPGLHVVVFGRSLGGFRVTRMALWRVV